MSSPSSQSLFPRLMAIADALEADPAASPPVLRETLLRATTALCVDQGLAATPAQIEQAVEANLATIPNDKGTTENDVDSYDFGWNRPRSAEAVQKELRWLDRWPRRLARLGWSVRRLRSPVALLSLAVATAAIVAWSSTQLMQGMSSLALDVPVGLLGLGCWSLLGLWIRDTLRCHELAPAPALDIKEQIEWRHWFVARDYVRHALAASGDLMIGDIAEVRTRMRRRAQEIKKDSAISHRHRQLEDMARW